MAQVNAQTIHSIAKLANLPTTAAEEEGLAKAFTETLKEVEKMSELDTQAVEPTHQVTELENVWREDKVTPERTFSQSAALAGASKTYQGFFVVPAVLTEK